MEGGLKIKSFRDLLVWQKAMDLALSTYAETRQFPSDERFGLTFELRKTARSIPSNVAEGSKRATTADLLRFLNIAAGSAAELATQLLLAERLGYFSGETAKRLLDASDEVERMIAGLCRSLHDAH